MLILHEDAFYEFFRPYRNNDASHPHWIMVDGGDDADQPDRQVLALVAKIERKAEPVT